LLQENGKWQEKDGKLIAMTDTVDYDIEGMCKFNQILSVLLTYKSL